MAKKLRDHSGTDGLIHRLRADVGMLLVFEWLKDDFGHLVNV
jgi:hypothetical protein